MSKGYLCTVLHCHLPFVRHPEHDVFMEEDWFYEAVAETYIPLLIFLERLTAEGVKPHITLSLTPPLCEMMADHMLQERCSRYLLRWKTLCEEEAEAKSGSVFSEAADFYRSFYTACFQYYENDCGRRLLPRFRSLMESGAIEIITCAATHGLLPLMINTRSVHAQIEVACRNYEKHFGRRPQGIWLPECAYAEGLDLALKSSGLQYFFLASHGLLLADPQPVFGVFAPILCPSGVAAFGRDIASSKEVWSSRDGYPGDPAYREFYRDLGWDADYEYIKQYLHPDGHRHNIGLKYHRITGGVALSDKAPYAPSAAREKASAHASDFINKRTEQCRALAAAMKREPMIVAPYDAELFGHWWFEGPWFLEDVYRRLAAQDDVIPITPSMYLEHSPVAQVSEPCPSSWGCNGYYEVWLNGSNHWIYRHMHHAEDRMAELAESQAAAVGLERRALNQAARELLLLQSSDWAFLMTMGTARCYATRRANIHIQRFNRLYEMVKWHSIDEDWLTNVEKTDNIFTEMDYRVYSGHARSEAEIT